jgi:AcrR family transcriptional regulator
MLDIASDAGVAVGTLYCHYPTKAALVAAVLEDCLREIASLAEAGAAAVAAGGHPCEELASVLRDVATFAVQSRALRAAVRSLRIGENERDEDADPASDSPLGRTFAAFDAMISAARRAGCVRPDTTRLDLSLLLHGVFEADVDEASRARYIDLVMAGLASRN